MWEGWKGCTRSPPGCGRPPPVLTGCVRASHAFHTRRRHSGVACGKGGKGVRAPIHLPHQAHRTRSARGRAFHASHRTPPRFLPHSGPQTRGTTPPAAGRRRRKPKPAANPPGLRHRRITDVPCLTPLHSHGESTGRTDRRSLACAPSGLSASRATAFSQQLAGGPAFPCLPRSVGKTVAVRLSYHENYGKRTGHDPAAAPAGIRPPPQHGSDLRGR